MAQLNTDPIIARSLTIHHMRRGIFEVPNKQSYLAGVSLIGRTSSKTELQEDAAACGMHLGGDFFPLLQLTFLPATRPLRKADKCF